MAKKSYTQVIINRSAVKSFLDGIKNGVMFGVTFTRRTPKCTGCGRSLKSFIGKDTCHFCGSKLSFEGRSVAQKGVHKANENASRHGISAKTAANTYGLLQFYNVNADNKKGGYRSCGFAEIKSIRSNGIEYIVK